MSILIVNQPLRNHGDEAAHRAFIHALREAMPRTSIRVLFVAEKPEQAAAFDVHDPYVEYVCLSPDRLFYKTVKGSMLLFLPFKKLIWKLSSTARAMMREFSAADSVICAPGGTCLGAQQSWRHLMIMYMAVRSNARIAYWGRSIGPFPAGNRSQRIFRRYALECLRHFGFVSLRDRFSMELAGQLGLNAVEVTDSAFLEKPSQAPAGLPAGLDLQGPYTVFVPNVLNTMAGFRELGEDRTAHFFSEVLRIILARAPGRVIMLPQLFGDGLRGDEAFFRRIAAGAGGGRVSVAGEDCGSDLQQGIIAGASCVVGARYHSVVFAINSSRPFVAFSYEHKISGLLRILGLEDRMIDLQAGVFDSPENEKSALDAFDRKFAGIGALSKCSREPAAAKVGEGFGKLIQFLENESI